MNVARTLLVALSLLSIARAQAPETKSPRALGQCGGPNDGLRGGVLPPRAAIKNRAWPQKVSLDAGATQIQIGVEDAATRQYVYCSQHFEFIAPGKVEMNVLKELAEVAEGTFRLIEALPWGVEPRSPLAFYRAKLYDTRGEYQADLNASPTKSAVPSYAIYDGLERLVRVPLNFEMERYDGGLRMVRKVEPKPLVHEVTHQMMHDYIQVLPQWAVEGTAEYTEMLPYKAGAFAAGDHERGMKEYLRTQGSGTKLADLGKFYDHMRMTREEWNKRAAKGGIDQHRLYLASAILVYYFSHIDGDGKGTRFLAYLDKMAVARDAWETFFMDPRVTLKPNGDIYSTIPLPRYDSAFGLEHLSILFAGRSPEELQKSIVDGYKKIGMKL